MRTRFGATLGLATLICIAGFLAVPPEAHAQIQCGAQNVNIQIGTIVNGIDNGPGVPIEVPTGTVVQFYPFVTLTGTNPPQQVPLTSADWWFTFEPLQPDPDTGNFPPADTPNRDINPVFPVTADQNLVGFTYSEAGSFDVGVRVRFNSNNQLCPPPAQNGSPVPVVATDLVNVVESPTANFDAAIEVVNDFALVPLNNWVPLFSFVMADSGDDRAPRALSRLWFSLIPNPNGDGPPPYSQDAGGPIWNNVLEFGIFNDRGPEGPDGVLDLAIDGCPHGGDKGTDTYIAGMPVVTWDAQGYPYERRQENGQRNLNDASYDLSFLFDTLSPDYTPPGTDPDDPDGTENPLLPLDEWVVNGPGDGNAFIVGVRLSSSWESTQHMSVVLHDAEMLPFAQTNGEIFLGASIANDNFPDFPLVEDVGYSSSFETFDIRSERAGGPATLLNQWNWPNYSYTPLTEFVRPRWDAAAPVDFVFGETLDLRDLYAVEAWTPLLGISAHGFTPGGDGGQELAAISELNFIVTDIGADPYGPPGNGGFNPNLGLETFTSKVTTIGGDRNTAIGTDHSFNGIWLYHDSNDSGSFDLPTPFGGSGPGIAYGADTAMLPDFDFPGPPLPVEDGLYEWEYVPFPPGGGDPWWKIRLRFDGDRRRNPPDSPTGYLTAIPDSVQGNAPFTPKADYFVVLRADSGFADVSGRLPDGTGIGLGADSRFFVEPRRWNPTWDDRGRWDGGILLSPQTNNPDNLIETDTIDDDPGNPGNDLPDWQWQEDPRWDIICPFDAYPCPTEPEDNVVYPWWNEQTANRDTNKPIKVGADVHDLVLTLSTNSLYAKETIINVGQQVGQSGDRGPAAFPFFMDPPLFPPAPGMGIPFPFGILQYRFINLEQPTIVPDIILGPDDIYTQIQYSYETVPFKLNEDAIDAQFEDPRSFFFPNPQEQPTIPRAQTWPLGSQLFVIGSGFSSYVYLESEGDIPNEPFLESASSNSEATYRDDVYVAVLTDGAFGGVSLEGDWLVDENGAKFRILSNVGNRLTLDKGHAAYLDRQFRTGGGDIQIPDHPYQVPIGENLAVLRGAWLVVEDTLPRGTYPRQSDWPEGLFETLGEGVRAARLLKQHTSPESRPTAMLGVNLVATDDPVVNAGSPVSLNSLTVAFWGPEFTPDDLQPLDPNGELFTAGVILYEDADQDGVFGGTTFDRIVPLEENSLRWTSVPEPIDINGDSIADDMSGDGVVSLGDGDDLTPADFAAWDGFSDRAWVLRLQPLGRWRLPQADIRTGAPSGTAKGVSAPGAFGGQPIKPHPEIGGASTESTFGLFNLNLDAVPGIASAGAKALPAGGSLGDDLFVVVRTSDSLGAFEQFRALVPSTLPSRAPQSEQVAGIETTSQAYFVPQSYDKSNPDEGAVQDFYGHDMLEANIGARVIPLDELLQVNGVPTIEPGSPAQALLGIDVSTNRPEYIAATGTSGTVAGETIYTTGGTITPTPDNPYFVNNAWTTETVGLYLMALSQGDPDEARYEAYEITGVSGTDLTLRAGAPRGGSPWAVIRDPSFLEQVVVEFYDEGGDGRFDLQKDFLPLDFEDPINGFQSGVAIYRDNDWHAGNTNGVFDPPVRDENGMVLEYIDLPVRLDDPPTLIGTIGGEPEIQVRFVFSSPGTDHFTGRDPLAYEQQPRLRQWVPQTYGSATADPDFGPDFFVVARTTRQMALGDDFFAAIASWGPDTPTEPDPDNFSVSLPGNLPGQSATEFDIFSEYPWGSRALGFITFFRDPPPVRYWTQDRDTSRLIVRSEVDHSQDNRNIRYWIRSNTNTFGRTNAIIASQPPSVDFTVNRIRQVPEPFCETLADPPADCGEIQFTLVSQGTIASVLWDFGDGTTSTERNPVHSYQNVGVYTVKVTVTDAFGVEDSEEKTNLIQIMEAPLADFSASPLDGRITPKIDGPDGLDVAFVDLSIGTDDLVPVSYFWNFGDGVTTVVTDRPTAEEPLIHRYTTAGFYTVTLEVTFRNDDTSQTQVVQCRRANLINVRPCIAGCDGVGEGEGEGGGEGEPEDPPAADITFTDFIRDREALVPLHDWVPLFEFTMGFPIDSPAPRVLSTLIFDLFADGREPDDLNYGNISGPEQSDLLEFAFFQQSFDDSDEDNTLNFENDNFLFSFDNSGAPIGTLTPLGGALRYQLDLIGGGTPADPEFPLVAAPVDDEGFAGNSYILAVRTSATWRSQTTLAYEVLRADMVIPATGVLPRNAEGDAIDAYSPDFPAGETFNEETAYSASFGAYDSTGGLVGTFDDTIDGFTGSPANFWNYPMYLYMPLDEHTRPRWNQIDRLLNFGGGELLEMRELLPMEAYWPVVNLNIHSSDGEHFEGFADRYGGIDGNASLIELNLVLTDIGADPFGPPGNGGFNARDGLEQITQNRGIAFEPVTGADYAYNGAWVWYDFNGNGRFDPPAAVQGQGITFTDRPMRPLFVEGAQRDWEWVPLPPGGGDPWWKISMRFDGLARQQESEDPLGFLEASPDNFFSGDGAGASEISFDYFVVVRTDSGFQDVSLVQGDQKGIETGADFRAFVEPRRFDPVVGSESGGVYIDSMIPPLTLAIAAGGLHSRWQDDPQFTDSGLPSRWGQFEPWWPQRTMNEKSAKPNRVGLEVHDLVMTYEPTSAFYQPTALSYVPIFVGNSCLGYARPSGLQTTFDRWADPLNLLRNQFFNRHGVDVLRVGGGTFSQTISIGGLDQTFNILVDDNYSGQFAYETVPFKLFDPVTGELQISDVRSSALPVPPDPPTVPSFETWPKQVGPNELQRASQWDKKDAEARLLTQKTDILSGHVAMLGINAVGTSDPTVNDNNAMTMGRITVAFWGPDFNPSDLAALDANGENLSSGVLLWEDADQSGTFMEFSGLDPYFDSPLSPGIVLDNIVPLRNLAWGNAPELVDLDGDSVADDMNGDGIVSPADRAWVLQIVPDDLWEVPQNDTPLSLPIRFVIAFCGSIGGGGDAKNTILSDPADYVSKALDPAVQQPADDLFITVRTSDRLKRFEAFRAVIPATLPERATGAERRAGIQFFPGFNTSAGGVMKMSPDEDPVQDFYGHDMLEINVPVKLTSLVNSNTNITIGGPALAVLGIDASTNQGTANGTLVSGAAGASGEASFVVGGAAWGVDDFAGDFLIDAGFESYRILSNTANRLTLESGTPREGAFRIVRNPTFLEEVTVEFYNEGTDADFSVANDLLPLMLDQEFSGVALYRDNDGHAENTNGVFDPFVDIPLQLDGPPHFVGQTGEDTQVRFVFSSPGTDTYGRQTRTRQWIYDTFGGAGDPATGADFFIVLRASNDMQLDDNLRVGIVSWGPNTPTEPDPDSFAPLDENDLSAPVNDFAKFREFNWSQRGLGFITYFKEPQTRYFLDGARAGKKVDNSGFDWVRSHSAKKRRTGIITARTRPTNNFSVVITSVSEPFVPPVTLPGESFDLVIRGSGFGTRPQVVISGYEVDVVSATATAIDVAISTPGGVPAQDPVVIIIRNPDTGEESSNAELLQVREIDLETPVITGISPGSGDENVFPVTITGTNLPDRNHAYVTFGNTIVPVLSVSPAGSSLTVGYPAGGFPQIGPMDVMVRAVEPPDTIGPEDIRVGGFNFVSNTKTGLFGCAPAAPAKSGGQGDLVVLFLAALLLVLASLRRNALMPLLRVLTARGPLVALLALLGLAFAQPAAAFFPIGGYDANQILRLSQWPFGTFDLNNNGQIEANEGIEVIVEVGPSGFSQAEVVELRAALDTWANVGTSYADFRIRGFTEDFILSGLTPDTIQTISLQVTGLPDVDEDVVADPSDVLIGELGEVLLGINITLFALEADLLPTPEGGVFIPAGTIIDSDVIISDLAVRPLVPGLPPIGDLRSVLVHELGHFLGIGNTPLNNVAAKPASPNDAFALTLEEEAVFFLTDATGVQQKIGVTPTMFPLIFKSLDADTGVRGPGWATLSPDDISAVSWLYPRGSQSKFFNLNDEARSETRPSSGLPSIGLPGAHIVAWADHDNNSVTSRIPMFSTLAGYYEPLDNLGLQGLFNLNYIWKQFEVAGAQPAAFFNPSYTFTSNPLNSSGFARQAPPLVSPAEFDSLQGPASFSANTRGDDAYTNNFPSEVFEEIENILDVENKDAGTPMVWSFELNTLVSAATGRTLPSILSSNRPMFGDPNDVCPLNLVQGDSGGGGTTTPDTGDVPDPATGALLRNGGEKLRGLRDGILLQSVLGTAFVDAYYTAAPAVTAFLKANGWAFAAFRYLVISMYWTMEHAASLLLMLTALGAGLWAARKGRARALIARLFVALLLAGASFSAHAASAYLTDAELATNADAVITGTVLSAEGRWALGGRIYTDVVLEVEDTVKGAINKQSQFTFSVLGGRVGGFVMRASALPTFAAGDEVVLFMKQLDNGEFVMYAGDQGRIRISSSKSAKVVDRPEILDAAQLEDGTAKAGEPDGESEEATVSGGEAMPLGSYLDFLRDVVRKQKRAEQY